MSRLRCCLFFLVLLISTSEVVNSFNLVCPLLVQRSQLIGHRSTSHLAADKMSSADLSSQSHNDNNVGQMLGGLVFIKTRDLASLEKFYTETIGMQLWLEQPNITILHHGNMILGFHQIQTWTNKSRICRECTLLCTLRWSKWMICTQSCNT
mmetsp:Transcript_5996/g.10020  ORF Transcript_5996/g.10020 Transcript_5996/m.10020 type:complete len:152 (+) Transcript_5996:142-597(+)